MSDWLCPYCGDTQARAERAEAAIDRVVRLAANCQRRFDSSIRHPADIASIPIEEVFAALDGAE